MIRSAVFLRQPGGGKVSPQGRKFVRDLRITGAGRIEHKARRNGVVGIGTVARTGPERQQQSKTCAKVVKRFHGRRGWYSCNVHRQPFSIPQPELVLN